METNFRPRIGAVVWSAGLVGLTLFWALGGQYGRPLSGFALPGTFWWIVWALAVAATLTMAAGRPPALLAVAAALPVPGTFGLVMHLVAALGNGYVENPPALLTSTYFAIGTLLSTHLALTARRTAHGLCPRCGYAHPDVPTRGRVPLSPAPAWRRVLPWPAVARRRVLPPPAPASLAVRWTAYVGVVAFVPYIGMKVVWALGVPIAGFAGPHLAEGTGPGAALGRVGIDLTSVLALAGSVLSVALVRPWGQVFPSWTPFVRGRRVPRWVPLVPAWLGATSLGLYPFVALGLLVSGADLSSSDGVPAWVTVVGLAGFGGWGITVGVAALSYQRRTRPKCLTSSSALARS